MMHRIAPTILLALAAAAAPSLALAHSWYPLECCSGQDCHPVPCETLRENRDGSLTYTPTSNDFEARKIRPSQDAHCHICTSSPDGRGYAYCAFTVQGF
jgi:hypothetical protein